MKASYFVSAATCLLENACRGSRLVDNLTHTPNHFWVDTVIDRVDACQLLFKDNSYAASSAGTVFVLRTFLVSFEDSLIPIKALQGWLVNL